MKDRPGSIKEVTDVIRSYGKRIVSILSSYDEVTAGYRKVYIRMRSIERPQLQNLIKDQVKDPELQKALDKGVGDVLDGADDMLNSIFGKKKKPKKGF